MVTATKYCQRIISLGTFLTLVNLCACVSSLPTIAPLYTLPPSTATPPYAPTTTPLPTSPATTTHTHTMTPTPTVTIIPATPTTTLTPTSTEISSPTPSPSLTASATPLPLIEPQAVTLHTPDGFILAATLYTPNGAGPFPGVLLSHMGGANKEAWKELPALLYAVGYVVLTYDFRGHGQSQGHLDPPSAATDLRTALAYLRSQPQVDRERIALVGASMGGMASVIVGADDAGVRTVVAISSPPDAAGQYPGQVVAQLSPRPFLAIGCDKDPVTRPERVRQMYEIAGTPKRVVILTCAAHANDILETEAGPRLQNLLLFWLNYYVKTAP